MPIEFVLNVLCIVAREGTHVYRCQICAINFHGEFGQNPRGTKHDITRSEMFRHRFRVKIGADRIGSVDIVGMYRDWREAMRVCVTLRICLEPRPIVGEIIPHRERLECLSESGTPVGEDIVEVAHFAVTAVGSVAVKFADNVVSEPFCHIQRPDNRTVFPVSDAAIKCDVGMQEPSAQLVDVIVIRVGFVGFIRVWDVIAIVNSAAIVSHDFYPCRRCLHEPRRHVCVIGELDAV